MPTDTRGDMEQAPGVATVRSSKAAWEGSVPADVIPTTWCGERALRGAVGRGRAQQGAVGGAGRGGAQWGQMVAWEPSLHSGREAEGLKPAPLENRSDVLRLRSRP